MKTETDLNEAYKLSERVGQVNWTHQKQATDSMSIFKPVADSKARPRLKV